LGYIIICISCISVFLIYRVSAMIKRKTGELKSQQVKSAIHEEVA
jgi:hypothetical protein